MAVGKPVDEFELMRRRVKQESQQAGQQRQTDLKRQFARSGNLSSGAFIKQSGIEQQQQQQQAQRAVEGVDIAEAGVRRQEREAEKGRTFSREERIGGQEFATSERIGGQEFVATQQDKQNTFAALQAQLGRDFTTSEREASQIFAETSQETQNNFLKAEAKKGRDLQTVLAGNAQQLQQDIFDFEKKETVKINSMNAMNALLNMGFNHGDVQDLLEQLGLGEIDIPRPPGQEAHPYASLPVEQSNQQILDDQGGVFSTMPKR
jgi:hypothetical protein